MQRSARSEIVPLPLTPLRAPADAGVGRLLGRANLEVTDDKKNTPPDVRSLVRHSRVRRPGLGTASSADGLV